MGKEEISKIVKETIDEVEKKVIQGKTQEDIDEKAVIKRLEKLKLQMDEKITLSREDREKLAGEIYKNALKLRIENNLHNEEMLDRIAKMFDDIFWSHKIAGELADKFDFVDENSEFTKEYVIKSLKEKFLKESKFKVPVHIDPDQRKKYFNNLAEKLLQDFKAKGQGWGRNNINENDFRGILEGLEKNKKYESYDYYLKEYSVEKKEVKIGEKTLGEIKNQIDSIGKNIEVLEGKLAKVQYLNNDKSKPKTELDKLNQSFLEVDEREIGFLEDKDIGSLKSLETDISKLEGEINELLKQDFEEKKKQELPEAGNLWNSITEDNFETTKQNFQFVKEIKDGLKGLKDSGYKDLSALESEFQDIIADKPNEKPAMTNAETLKKLQNFKTKLDTVIAQEKAKFAEGDNFLNGLQETVDELKREDSKWAKAAGKALEGIMSFIVSLSGFLGKIPFVRDWLPNSLKFSPNALSKYGGLSEKVVDITKKAIGILSGVFAGMKAEGFVNKIKDYKISDFLKNFDVLKSQFTGGKQEAFLSLIKGYAIQARNKGQNVLDLITDKFTNKETLEAKIEKIGEFSNAKYGKTLITLGMTVEGTKKLVEKGNISVQNFMSENENLLSDLNDKEIFQKIKEYIQTKGQQNNNGKIADFVAANISEIEKSIYEPEEETPSDNAES